MAAPKIYGDDLRQAVHQLINEEQRPATQIAPILKDRGFQQIPPVDTMRDWARASRHTITDRPKAEQLRQLTGQAVSVIHDAFARIQATPEDSDADETLKLVRSLRELEPLLTDRPTSSGKDEPKGLLGGMDKRETPAPEPTTSQVTPLRSLRT